MEISHKVKEHYEALTYMLAWFKDHRLSREMAIVHSDLEKLQAYYKIYLMPMYEGTEDEAKLDI